MVLKDEIKQKSCGCIIIDDNKILLIQQKRGDWGFPKGHMEAGETEEETAKREVKEETNLDVKIDTKKRYTMEYIIENGDLKQVVLFIAKKANGEPKAQAKEINAIKWVKLDEAIETITRENTRILLKKVLYENNLL